MRITTARGGAALILALIVPGSIQAQVQTLKDYHVGAANDLRSKFAGLAEAIPENRYDWKPMDGTRSVRDVLALVAAEANIFPGYWGLPIPQGSVGEYRAETARLAGAASTKAELIAQLNRSFDHLIRSLARMSDAERAADGRTFGRSIKVDAGITLALSDMHEHLGQLIAYARMNQVVPPWSR